LKVIDEFWYGTTLEPENNNDIRILQELWDAIPENKKHIGQYPQGKTFLKTNINDKTIFIASGE